MNELAVKLAELLDMTVQQAVKLYPVLRGQYIWYSISTYIETFGSLLTVIFGVGITTTAILWWIEKDWLEEDKRDKAFKFMKWCALGLLVGFIVIGIANVMSVVLATDLNFILEFLNQ